MAVPVAGIIAGAAAIGGSAMNMAATSKMNRKTIQYNERMYLTQRKDNLADWHMQNQYSSPVAQMQRLREAGLNPRLIYGEGAGAGQMAAPMRSAEAKSINLQAPQMDLRGVGNAVMDYYDVQIKQAQVDNLKLQYEVMEQEKLLKAAQVIATSNTAANTAVGTQQREFDLSQAERLKDVSVEQAVAGLRKTSAETDVLLSRNEREAAMNAVSISKAAEEILKIRADTANSLVQRRQIEQQIENLKRDTRLKDLDIELKRLGIQPGDPMYMRALGRLLNSKDFNPRFEVTVPEGWNRRDSSGNRPLLDSMKIPYKSGYQLWKERKFGKN